MCHIWQNVKRCAMSEYFLFSGLDFSSQWFKNKIGENKQLNEEQYEENEFNLPRDLFDRLKKLKKKELTMEGDELKMLMEEVAYYFITDENELYIPRLWFLVHCCIIQNR